MKELERYLLLGGQIIWSPVFQIPKLAIFRKNRKASEKAKTLPAVKT